MKTQSLIAICAALALSACTTSNDPSTRGADKTLAGAGLGAAAGAIAGLIVGQTTDADTRKSVLIGAGIGALAGGSVGAYMDQQEEELRRELAGTGVIVTRTGDQITLTMPSNITFDVDQAVVKPQFFHVLDGVSRVLVRFDRSLLDVYGHTDNTGSDQHNLALSERRALSVAQYINQRGVDGRRLQVLGFGESRPIADNSSEGGRAANRRVEIFISPLSS